MRRSGLMSAASVAVLSLLFVVQAAAAQGELAVRGRIGRTVEAGGWLIDSPKQKYLLLNADRWQGETWFGAGAEVEATGEVRRDVVTTQMEGTPFQARTLRAAGAAGGQGTTAAAAGASLPTATRVVVSGDSLVQARPDTAMISVAVVTQAQTALAAQQENARRSEAMVRALKSAAGAGAEVETSGYSLQPQYNYRENQTPIIRGYEARNTVTVTLGDLSKVGPVIDASTAAGANNIDNLSFTLRRDEPARDQALAAATREALRKAQVMAVALGGRVGRIVEVQEASMGRPIPIYDAPRARGMVAQAMEAKTPVEIGTLDIRAQVQLVAEIITER